MPLHLSTPSRSVLLAGTGLAIILLGLGALILLLQREMREQGTEPHVTVNLASLEHPENAEEEVRAMTFRTRAEATFGRDVSLAYDLLPLLHAPATLSLTAESGRIISFFVEGSVGDAQTLHDRLTRLHGSIRSRLAQIQIERKNFEQGFSALVVRDAPLSARESVEEINGWDVRSTIGADGTGLVSASSDHRYALGSERNFVEGFLKRHATPALAITCRIRYPLAECRF